MMLSDISAEELYQKLGNNREGKSIIYFMGAEGSDLIKMGITQDIYRRVFGLNTASPLRLILLSIIQGDKSSESLLHRAFDKNRLRGEWFSPSGKLYDLIDHINKDSHSQTKHKIARINSLFWPEGVDFNIRDHHKAISHTPWQEHCVYVFVGLPFNNSPKMAGRGRFCEVLKLQEDDCK